MLTSVRSLLTATVLAGAALAATPAMAQDDLGISVSGNAAIVTDYRFRGVSLSGGDFAAQGGIDIGTDAGFYIGTWGSSLANSDTTVMLDDGSGDIVGYDVGGYGALELDIYAGWSGEITDGLGFDVGALYYLYPNATNKDATSAAPDLTDYPVFDGYAAYDTDYWELYASLSPSLGPVDSTVGVAYAPKQDSLGGTDNLYLYLDLGMGIPETPISLSGHLGYTDGSLAPDLLAGGTDGNGLDWSIGADVAIGDKLSLGVAYVGTEGTSVDKLTDDAVVGTLSVSF